MKNVKRILEVIIRTRVDIDPDTSYLGEYSSKKTSEFSIDRAHSDYLGISAEAYVCLTGDTRQVINSGGVWGIESDSDSSYLQEVKDQELSDLKDQLVAIGFSRRAIAKAFQTKNEKEE